MAKRIKVKGKAPRGLSKAQRIKISSLAQKRNKIVNAERKRVDPGDVSESTLDAIDRYDYLIDEIAERPDISHGASSKRKKRVKEGNRKFIGPRQLKNVDKEEVDNEFGIRPDPSRNYGWKANIRGGQFKEESRPDFDSIGSERLKEMLINILYERGLAMPF